jgi:uncharacterized protein
MKKTFLTLLTFFAMTINGQEIKQFPMISVSGEGKIKIEPDQAGISISVESKGNDAVKVKKENDSKMDAVIKFIKKMNLPNEDYQTQRVSLNPNYDYEKKAHNYIATQTLEINLKDLSIYDTLMQGLVETGVNRIDNVQFKSSKLQQIQSDCRKLAVKDAKAKAEDLVSVLGQKVGKAISISDNSQGYNPQPVVYAMRAMAMDSMAGGQQETLAPGKIEIVVNVSISFMLE